MQMSAWWTYFGMGKKTCVSVDASKILSDRWNQILESVGCLHTKGQVFLVVLARPRQISIGIEVGDDGSLTNVLLHQSCSRFDPAFMINLCVQRGIQLSTLFQSVFTLTYSSRTFTSHHVGPPTFYHLVQQNPNRERVTLDPVVLSGGSCSLASRTLHDRYLL